MDSTFVSALVSAVIAVLVAVINNHYNRPKVKADSDLSYAQAIRQIVESSGDQTEMAMKLAEVYARRDEELNKKISNLETKVDDLQKENRKLSKRVQQLEEELRRQQIPVPDELTDTGDRMKAAR